MENLDNFINQYAKEQNMSEERKEEFKNASYAISNLLNAIWGNNKPNYPQNTDT